MTQPPDPHAPVYLGGPPGVGIAVPADVAAELARLRQLADEHTAKALHVVTVYAGKARVTAADLDAAVQTARAAGATWQQIGDAAGLTKQAAHQRWGGADRG
jgi:hypothetical protein